MLVVEDDPATRYLYGKFLDGTGFRAVPAASLDQARRALREFRPAAVILDVQLGGADAWGAAARS